MSPSLRGAGAAGVTLFTLALLCPAPSTAFEVNDRHWDQMPIPLWVNPANAPDMGMPAEEVVAQAISVWEKVGCAAVSFQVMGTTTAELKNDGASVVFWVTSGWGWGESAAGATIWIPPAEGEPQEVDLPLNAETFKWVPGGGNALQSDTVDPASVIAHEFGHWLGLSHTPEPFATMYFALLPNGVQGSLDADDKAGICTLYPNGTFEECQQDEQCPVDPVSGAAGVCQTYGSYKVCGEKHDQTGDFCSKTHINCQDMCWAGFAECNSLCVFTAFDYSAGYCANLCVDQTQCPAGYLCKEYPQYEISACAPDGTVAPDQNPESVEMAEVVEVVEVVEAFPDVSDVDFDASESVNDLASYDALPKDGNDAGADSGRNDQNETDLAVDSKAEEQPPKPDSGCLAASYPTSALPLLLLVAFLIMLPRIRRFGA